MKEAPVQPVKVQVCTCRWNTQCSLSRIT